MGKGFGDWGMCQMVSETIFTKKLTERNDQQNMKFCNAVNQFLTDFD
jgi:hypothetical protein